MTDDNWVTPPPPADLATLIPELAPLARTTTRLHPRLGTPSVFESSMGAKPLWPAGEAWPTCPGPHVGTYDEEPVAAVPLLQLFRRDVHQLPFPEGTDLLQVLWCPRDHDDFDRYPAGPKTSLYWRDSAVVSDVIPEIPVTPAYHGQYMLQPCVLHPEPGVVEYPAGEFMPEGRSRERLAELDEQLGCDAYTDLFAAPGTKVGGWPRYRQDPYWPECAGCSQRLEYLLSVDDLESSNDRWNVVSRENGAIPGLKDLGHGIMQLYYCPRCPGLPHTQYYHR